MSEQMAERSPMQCVVSEGTCPCSLVTATGGTCEVFGPPPTFAEAFPYLTATTTTTRALAPTDEEIDRDD